jgi:hypothetical protein
MIPGRTSHKDAPNVLVDEVFLARHAVAFSAFWTAAQYEVPVRAVLGETWYVLWTSSRDAQRERFSVLVQNWQVDFCTLRDTPYSLSGIVFWSQTRQSTRSGMKRLSYADTTWFELFAPKLNYVPCCMYFETGPALAGRCRESCLRHMLWCTDLQILHQLSMVYSRTRDGPATAA